MEAEFDKLDITKMVNVSTSLKNSEKKVNDLDFVKLKIVPVDLKKVSDVVDNDVVKNTKFNTLETKVNNLEKKIPDATTLTHIIQYNTDKQNLEKKKLEILIKKIPDVSGLVNYTCVEYKN